MPMHPLVSTGQIFTIVVMTVAFVAILVAAYEFGRRK